MFVGIHHVAINVRDFDRMCKFYRDAFGFETAIPAYSWSDAPLMDQAVDVPNSSARHAMLKAGTCYLEIFEYLNPEASLSQALRPFDKGYTHFCMESDDIENDVAHLKNCGMSFTDRDVVAFANASAIYGYDPEGNIIEIQQCGSGSRITLDMLNECKSE